MATDSVPFGIQLWTLRDDFPEKPAEISKQLAGFGYRQIETFENEQGMFCGMQAAEVKALMDDVGLQLVSAHCNMMDNFEHKVEQAAEAGVQYLVVPFKLGHVKDRASVEPEVMRASTTLGKGVINYEQLLPVARENGMQKFFVEQEEYEGSTPLAAARDGAAYMTSMPGFRK